jgi:SAM-dependent methyltransferase
MIDRSRTGSGIEDAKVANTPVEYFSAQAADYQARSMRFPWAWMRAREWAAVRDLLGEIAGAEILELGAGAGYYTRELIRCGARHVWAVDLSEAMLSRLPSGPITPVRADAASFRLEKRFPILLSTGMLEFVADPVAVLVNASLHAKTEARLVLLVPRANVFGRLYQRFHHSHGVTIQLFDRAWFENIAPRLGWHVGAMTVVFPFSLAMQLHRA